MCCLPLVRVIFSFPGENTEPRNIANLDVNVTQEANGGHPCAYASILPWSTQCEAHIFVCCWPPRNSRAIAAVKRHSNLGRHHKHSLPFPATPRKNTSRFGVCLPHHSGSYPVEHLFCPYFPPCLARGILHPLPACGSACRRQLMRPASIASDDGTELLVVGEYGSEGASQFLTFPPK